MREEKNEWSEGEKNREKMNKEERKEREREKSHLKINSPFFGDFFLFSFLSLSLSEGKGLSLFRGHHKEYESVLI